jgi:hypothetical protein
VHLGIRVAPAWDEVQHEQRPNVIEAAGGKAQGAGVAVVSGMA